MLRTATTEDANAITAVLIKSRQRFLPYAPSPHSAEGIQAWVAQHLLPRGGVTVAVEGTAVVAVLAVSEDEQAVWVNQLYVLPGYENRGYGSRLLGLAHQCTKRPIRLFTFQQNAGSRRFYERHGYKIIAHSDGHANEEKCPDVLYELTSRTEA
jgi:GNAT superfamily N-acetyltransferase